MSSPYVLCITERTPFARAILVRGCAACFSAFRKTQPEVMSQDPAWSLLAAGMLSPLQQTWLAQKLAQTQTMPVAASSTLDAQTVYLQALQQLETERLLRAHADASHSVGAPTTQTEAEKAEAATPATANTSGDKKTEPDQKTPLQMEEEDLTRKRKQMAEKDDEYVRQYQNVQRDQQERSSPADTKPAVDPDVRKNSHAHMARRVGKFRLEHGTLEIFAKFVPNEVEPSGIAETKNATGSRPPVLLIPQTKKMPSPPTRQTSKVPVPPPGPPPAHVLRQEANTEEDVEVQVKFLAYMVLFFMFRDFFYPCSSTFEAFTCRGEDNVWSQSSAWRSMERQSLVAATCGHEWYLLYVI